MKKTLFIAAAIMVATSTSALAWWNGDWANRQKIALDPGAVAAVTQKLERAPMLLRLSGGTVDFSKLRDDGADLRIVAGDDKTPLPFHIEKFDKTGEMALVWVDVRGVAPGAASNLWLYSGNASAKPVNDPAATYDGEQGLVLHFSDAAAPADQTANRNAVTGTSQPIVDGLIAGGARFANTTQVRVAPSASTGVKANGALTWSAWVKLDPAQTTAAESAVLTKMSAAGASDLSLLLRGATPVARLGGVEGVSGVTLQPGVWTHLAVTAGEKIRLYVDGRETAVADGKLPELMGETVIGSDGVAPSFIGDIDEVGQANTERSASAIAFAASTQGRDAAFAKVSPELESDEAGGHNYFGILLGALTPDAWVVIGILGVLAVLSWWVMFEKIRQVNAATSSNRRFLGEFKTLIRALGKGERPSVDASLHADSPLYRMYETGTEELVTQAADGPLNSQAFDVIRASLTSQMSREISRLNKALVVLTIAISGGPFLGLLGTVVGVMITFAAIAAAGDVNINAIAPGVAAALLATVAGLAVAIPALFGYNYLTTRIRDLISEMQVFVDEFATKTAKALT